MLKIDGSKGEGGGQVLRSSLSLSMLTGQPFEMKNIRAGRRKPGLMRQHLACVRAAQEICDAELMGDAMHSQSLIFKPKKIKAGNYEFAVGSAGSAGLVLQTLLPALMMCDSKSCVKVSGGTHNPLAPNADFLMETFIPQLSKMGFAVDLELKRHGFMPVGGGALEARIDGKSQLKALNLMADKPLSEDWRAEILLSSLEYSIGEKQLGLVMNKLNLSRDQITITKVKDPAGPGNAVLLRMACADVSMVFSAFGMKNLSSRHVIGELKSQALAYSRSKALVDEYLADQLMLPLAFTGGSYRATKASLHSETNKQIIESFLKVELKIIQNEDGTTTFSCDEPYELDD